MDDLEENILTLSEVLDVRAEREGMAEGWILESSVKPIGRVATVLVMRGTMRRGDIILAGTTWAKIKVLRTEGGAEIDEAPPGTPVEILGWKDLPNAGDQVLEAPDEGRAKDAARYRLEMDDRRKAAAEMTQQEKRAREKTELEGRLLAREGEGEEGEEPAADSASATKLVNFTVKGDVMGSVEAVCAAITEIGNIEVRPRILRSAPGHIAEFDVEHAATSASTIVNFGNPISRVIKKMAEDAGVSILDHTVIYHVADDVKRLLSEKLEPAVSAKVTGEAEILEVFRINIKGRVYKNIAGCRVRNGLVTKASKYRVLRGGNKMFDGKQALHDHNTLQCLHRHCQTGRF